MKKNDDKVIRYQKKPKKSITAADLDTDIDNDLSPDLQETKELDIREIKPRVLASEDLYSSETEAEGSKGDPMSKKPNNKKNKKKSSKFLNILTGFAALFLIGVLVVSIFVTTTVLAADPLTIESFEKTDSSVILDADGEVIYDLGEKLIENVEYEDISQSLIDAFIAIEDSRFFEHGGVDTPRFTSAIFMNIFDSLKQRNLSFDAGGASTLDMQLTRNSLFMYENVETGESQLPASSGLAGIQRKILEIYYSSLINNRKILSKKVIFQKYVNIANYGVGHNTLGVQKAANYYFDKSASELNLVESAFLAGIVNRPNRVTPYYRLSNAKERTETVLYYMNYHGYITKEEYDLAMSFPLENLFVDQSGRKGEALPNQAYIDVVLNEVRALTDLNPATTAMIIKTSMSSTLQKEFDRIQNRDIASLDVSSTRDSALQLASTVLENETGEIIGVIGGYDYYGQRVFNRSSDAVYQPGSSIKPFISYAPAFEYLGYSTEHVILDEPYYWSGTDILVNNYNNRFNGEVKLMDAVVDSLNVPAIKTFDEVNSKIGIEKYRDYVQAIGFTKHIENSNGKDTLNSQFAIGGSDFYTNTQELAGATATILNGGTYIKPHTIREIIIKDTQEVIESPYKGTPVLSDSAAYLTAETMRAVGQRSTGMGRVRRNYPLYGKTGTTNWGADGAQYGMAPHLMKDRLVVTGSDRFSAAIWTGFDAESVKDPDVDAYFRSHEVNFQLYAKIDKHIFDTLDSEFGKGKAIKRPDSVTEINYILGTYPYASPVAGMNKDLITRALIKKDAAALVDYKAPTIDAFKTFTHDVTQSMGRYNLNLKFDPYPDAEKLEVADSKLVMEARNNRKYTGRRLFDPSWIFGSVVYKADLYVDDKIVNSATSNTEVFDLPINASLNSNMKVCGYYTFDLNQEAKSNVVCQNIDMSNVSESIPVPGFSNNRGIHELVSFSNKHSIKLEQKRTDGNLTDYGKVLDLNPDLRNQTVTSNKLPKTWTANFSDVLINVSNYSTKGQLEAALGGYVKLKGGDSNEAIESVKDANGKTLNSFYIYDYYGSTLSVSTD